MVDFIVPEGDLWRRLPNRPAKLATISGTQVMSEFDQNLLYLFEMLLSEPVATTPNLDFQPA
jgi:hypothetical protein